MGCQTSQNNTNEGRCRFDISVITKAILLPEGTEYTGSDIDTFLLEKIHAAEPDKRAYPMPKFTGITDNSTEPVTAQNGYGQTETLMPGTVAFTQNYAKNHCLSNRLEAFNDGVTRDMLLIDMSGHVWGCEGKNGGIKGFAVKVYSMGAGIPTADAVVEPTISYNLQNPAEWTSKKVMSTDLSVSDLDGLEDIEIVTSTSGSDTILKMVTVCDGTDVTEELAALDASSTAFLQVSSAGTKSALTGVTYNATTKTFKVATASLSSAAGVTLADPSVLFTAGVMYKCCDAVTALS